jgi:hypothetical protein
MELPTKAERIEQIFFSMPRKHQQKYAETHKTLPADDHTELICFFEQCQDIDRANGMLDQIHKEKTEKAAKKTEVKKPREHSSKTNRRDRRRAGSHDRNDRYHRHGYRRHGRHDRSDRGRRYENSDRRDKAAHNHDHRSDRDGKHRGHDGKSDDCRRRDKDKHHVLHQDDDSKCSVSVSRGRSNSSRGSSVRSRSTSSSRSVVNHHMDEQGKASPRHPKRTHSYSEDEDDGHHHVPQEGDSIYATFAAPSKKSKKSRRKTA